MCHSPAVDIAATIAELVGINLNNKTLVPTAIDGRSFAGVLLSGGKSITTDLHRQAFLVEKLVTSDDYGHIPTPFVRYTGGSEDADIWRNWRSYPNGGNPGTALLLGRGAGVSTSSDSSVMPTARGFTVNGTTVAFNFGGASRRGRTRWPC